VLSRTIYKKRRGRNWLTGLAVLSLLTGSFVVSSTALAQLDRDLFELDKDATNDTEFAKVGVLNAALSTTATSVQICQSPATFADGTLILVDAERITLSNGASAAGGGCPSGFPLKRNYTAARAQDGTAAGAHAKGEDVSLIETGAFNGDDWDQVYDEISDDPDSKCTDLGAVECVFVHDGRAMSIFTQSKDYDEISNEEGATAFWQWRDQSVPDADELDDGFAIKYIDGNGDQQLYFGADRFAVNGTKDAGFWFFHDDVAPVPPANGGDGTFTGLHTAPTDGGDGFCNGDSGGSGPSGGQPSPVPACDYDDNDTGGDVLILTTFTGGGAVTTVRVFEWVGPAGSTAALLERGTASDCVPGDTGQELCATVNDTTIETAWPYSGKSEPANDEVASGGLLEGGVNLTDLGLEGCFSSFMATSRSSASLTADPKDFILGSFEACGATITTDASESSFEIGGSITDSATVTVTGGGPAPTGFVDFYVCGPTDGIASCDATGTFVSSEDLAGATGTPPEFTVTSDSFTPTTAGDYCFYAEYPADQDDNYRNGAFLTDFTDECFTVTPKQPTIVTQVNTEDPVSPGTEVWDTATLGNTATPSNGQHGTITFTVYGPDNATCAGTAVYTSVIAVTGDGDYLSKNGDGGPFAPTTPGTYNWIAAYAPDAGDVNNLPATTACGEAHESSVVRTLQPTMDTAQSFVPNDSATITVTNEAGALAGSVVFELFVNDTDCSGSAAYTSDPIDITTGTGSDFSKTVLSDNETAYSTTGDTFSWVVTYTSTNTGHESVSSPCGNETSSITIDNGVTQPPAP